MWIWYFILLLGIYQRACAVAQEENNLAQVDREQLAGHIMNELEQMNNSDWENLLTRLREIMTELGIDIDLGSDEEQQPWEQAQIIQRWKKWRKIAHKIKHAVEKGVKGAAETAAAKAAIGAIGR